MSRLIFGFMWLVRLLPLAAVAAIGNLIGAALFWLIAERRRVVRINLEKCFPQMPRREREKLARNEFTIFEEIRYVSPRITDCTRFCSPGAAAVRRLLLS